MEYAPPQDGIGANQCLKCPPQVVLHHKYNIIPVRPVLGIHHRITHHHNLFNPSRLIVTRPTIILHIHIILDIGATDNIPCSRILVYNILWYIFNPNLEYNMKRIRMVQPNDTFGKLRVNTLHIDNKSGKNRRYWDCTCECGQTTTKREDYLLQKLDICHSCGCVSTQAAAEVNWRGYGNITGRFFSRTRSRAKKHGIPLTITAQDAWEQFLKQDGRCALTGISLEISRSLNANTSNTASLDRIDSALGYTKDNIQWVHKNINIMKHTFHQEDFITWCGLVVNYSKRKRK